MQIETYNGKKKKKLSEKEKPNEKKNPSAMKPSGNVNGHRTKT